MGNGWLALGAIPGLLHSDYLVNYLLYFCSLFWDALDIYVKPNASAV